MLTYLGWIMMILGGLPFLIVGFDQLTESSSSGEIFGDALRQAGLLSIGLGAAISGRGLAGLAGRLDDEAHRDVDSEDRLGPDDV